MSESNELIALTADIVTAFAANNAIGAAELPRLITVTYEALVGLTEEAPALAPEVPEFTAAVTTRKSLGSREHIISMIDGKPYKSLKRHLRGHGLTPEGYRTRYNLPVDYPMTAPAYSEARRAIAKTLGLGRKPGTKVTPRKR